MSDDKDHSITLTYKYRVLPNKRQHAALAAICESQRQLYNGALEHRISAYRKAGEGVTLYRQMRELTELRQTVEFATIPANIQRLTLKQLDQAYNGFFRRLKRGEKPGFPRFRSKARWNSFGFNEFSGIRFDGKRIRFKGLPGGLRVHLHRPLPQGKILGCSFKRDVKGWNICLQIRLTRETLPSVGSSVGIDMGLSTLAMLSTGEAIPNPYHAKKAERQMRSRQRAFSRCKKGSNRRNKVRRQLTRLHGKVKNTRNTYLHQVSAKLIREYDLIAVEKLNIEGMAAGMLSKSVRDAAWGKLNQMIAYKAAWAGRDFIKVDCKFTSQTCPECGAVAKKALSERLHSCECGCTLDRDHAAALVILHRAVVRPGLLNVGQ